ncbi:amidase family protein [Curtobacterium sp. ZW137]|uniref:amidase family protein n=1 Tax=Curtobacterium sp. ZW137 TaxID=2485104 RepID=UPI000F4CE6B1|nr:amidase family protein [Curtobacterium sp. ZW137]ROP58544.1 amidase [Curtobacterium sp. ZW137]
MLDTDIQALRDRLESGATTALALAQHALRRIARIDRDGPRLGAVPVLDPRLLERAAASDAARVAGAGTGPLHGIPFTVKDSFAVSGLTAAAGSPAFAGVVSRRDAVVIERLLGAGAVLVGKTNMPPMAIGGGQAGLYGRTRSPYSPEWLAAAWHSGSSIGSGVAVAAGLCSFGLGEETVSSGRSPASNNGLVAYTPSWGVVPSTGNWPLHPYRDVVVPHTRSVADLREVLAVIAGPDERDVWWRQDAVDVLPAAEVAASFRTQDAPPVAAPLAGLRVGVPLLYVPEAAGPSDAPPSVPLRPSIRALWDDLEAQLVAAGAHVTRVRFPLVEAYEQRGDLPSLEDSGHLPADWTAFELDQLVTHSWQRFLDEHASEPLALADLAPGAIRPDPPDAVDAIENGRVHPGRDVFDFTAITRSTPLSEDEVARVAAPAIAGLDRARRELFEDWLTASGLDVLAFPANSDIGPHDADVDPAAARAAWADGAVFSTTNHVMRRVGIPSVTIPMGTMADTGMPVGATICGPAWTDAHLVDVAAALEARLAPRARARLPEVAELGAVRSPTAPARPVTSARAALTGTATIDEDGSVVVEVWATVDGLDEVAAVTAWVEVGSQSVVVPPTGTTAARFRLGPEVRRLHRATRVLALLTVVGPDGLVAAADTIDLPFHRPAAPAAAPAHSVPIRSTP